MMQEILTNTFSASTYVQYVILSRSDYSNIRRNTSYKIASEMPPKVTVK